MQQKESYISKGQLRKKTAIGLASLIVFGLACYAIWGLLTGSENNAGTPKPFRAALETNEKIFANNTNDQKLTKTYPISSAAKKVRVNGYIGLKGNFDTSSWVLQVVKAPGDTMMVTLEEIKALPKTEIVFDFKCIEGWSQISYWGGVRFSDFIKHYGLTDQARMKYTGMHTPDNAYYVGLDNASMMHPQTLLCYEMNGKPLPLKQGAPLRLIIPVKYGVKHLKRIGTIFFSNNRPPDYWYERGYDYFCGL